MLSDIAAKHLGRGLHETNTSWIKGSYVRQCRAGILVKDYVACNKPPCHSGLVKYFIHYLKQDRFHVHFPCLVLPCPRDSVDARVC